MLNRIYIGNFRRFGEGPHLEMGPQMVFFGPNGAGKSTLLDAIWLVRNCLIYGVTEAISREALKFGAVKNTATRRTIEISVTDEKSIYVLFFPESATGLSEHPGEFVYQPVAGESQPLLVRNPGEAWFEIINPDDSKIKVPLVSPGQLAALQVLNSAKDWPNWSGLVHFLWSCIYFRSRHVDIKKIKTLPEERSESVVLNEKGMNLWSVMKNLHDNRDTEEFPATQKSRYETILAWTSKAFPEFRGWHFNNPPNTNHIFPVAAMRDAGRVNAQHLPDGLIQFTLLVASLYSQAEASGLVMLDEPDLSLHPWALFVLAEAIQDATANWNRQVLVATHSPVLLSQFPEDSLYLVMPKDGSTTVRKLSEIEESKELLAQYAAGSLYMMQMIGEQSTEPMVHVVEDQP